MYTHTNPTPWPTFLLPKHATESFVRNSVDLDCTRTRESSCAHWSKVAFVVLSTCWKFLPPSPVLGRSCCEYELVRSAAQTCMSLTAIFRIRSYRLSPGTRSSEKLYSTDRSKALKLGSRQANVWAFRGSELHADSAGIVSLDGRTYATTRNSQAIKLMADSPSWR